MQPYKVQAIRFINQSQTQGIMPDSAQHHAAGRNGDQLQKFCLLWPGKALAVILGEGRI
jgi:hypothetical protein